MRPLPNALTAALAYVEVDGCSSAVPRRRGAPSAAVCALVCPIERWEIGSYQRDPASTRGGSSLSHEGEPRPDRAVLADVVPF